MIFVIIGLMALMVVLFLICAVLFPEWVGIAGHKAKQIEAAHRHSDSHSDSYSGNQGDTPPEQTAKDPK